MFIQILFIVIGAYFLIVNGILGLNWGRSRRYSDRMGQKTTRIIYVVAGAALIAYGTLSLFFPGILPE